MNEPEALMAIAKAVVKLGDAVFWGLIWAAFVRGFLNK